MTPLDLLDHWTDFARPLRAASQVAVLCDYDGTLAPIAGSPDAVRLPLDTWKQLQRLAANPRVILGIVSGRALDELRRQVEIENAWYAGMHGFEIRNPQGLERWWYTRKEGRRIAAIADQLERELASVPGALVERKGAAVAFHYRQVDKAQVRAVQDAVMQAWRKDGKGLRLRPGNLVLELLPTENRTKGTAVRFILGKIRSGVLPVYFGDDLTDLNAFRALRGMGIRVGVGDGVVRHLDYRVKDPAAVGETLKRIATLLGSK